MRKTVFNAALEQAEQLFAAAAAVDYATRPILVFYGLSQAGRAIAAAATGVDTNSWKLKGHGIEVANLDQEPPLADLALQDDGRSGSFTTIAQLLSSASLKTPATLPFLWNCIPELAVAPIGPTQHDFPVLRLSLSGARQGTNLIGWVGSLPERFLTAEHTDVSQFLANYPGLADGAVIYDHASGPAAAYRPAGNGQRMLSAVRMWPTPEGADVHALVSARLRRYLTDDIHWVFPKPPGADKDIHPLVAWWAVLFTLSMLARYHPANWIQHLDVSHRPTAVALELALDAAVEVCPQLILDAVLEVSS
ncbi:YaaC family protein [Amycolatopsis sp. NPDC051758]|uniref:YaaC family protein n=1 Tax=Amycolatopsis sp. NPDC051758 TaxID=3363935 RepID=UPI0037ABC596